MLILRLQHNQVELLTIETNEVYPIEACALLFGKLSINEAVVKTIKVVKNRLRSTSRFEVDPTNVATAVIEAEKEGMNFIGLFHSHPAPAEPSPIDIKFMHLWSDAIWLILSTTENRFAAYYLVNRKLKEATISIE
jgi:proteasome lid subunit RPN8/RPN11